MSARGWSRLSLVPWAVYAVGFGTWAVFAFSHGNAVAGWMNAAFTMLGVVMTVRAVREHRRRMREHEEALQRIRAIRDEAARRLEEMSEGERRRRLVAAIEQQRKNAPHN